MIDAKEDPSRLIWVCVHTNYLVEYYIRKERFDDALLKVDENIKRFEQLDKEKKIAKGEYFVTHVLRGKILIEQGKFDDAEEELSHPVSLFN